MYVGDGDDDEMNLLCFVGSVQDEHTQALPKERGQQLWNQYKRHGPDVEGTWFLWGKACNTTQAKEGGGTLSFFCNMLQEYL